MKLYLPKCPIFKIWQNLKESNSNERADHEENIDHDENIGYFRFVGDRCQVDQKAIFKMKQTITIHFLLFFSVLKIGLCCLSNGSL